ncbi:hypothetical protein BJ742DRAFT_252934 [Cladochytrium replicatum]|nr:hypothetical protein BJ742DRAFT_252934 [Cladochytrium replicatum]
MAEKIGRTQLSPTTPEYAYLEYGLQLTLKASTARIVTAHAISNPHISIQFEKRCKDILTLTSWTDVSQLGGSSTEEEVIRRGFQFKPSSVVSSSSNGGSAVQQQVATQSTPQGSTAGVSGGLMSGTASGMTFVVGSSLRQLRDKAPVIPQQPQKIIHRALVCKIGVGRAFVCDDAITADREPVPEGYDSFYLKDHSQTGESSDEYRHVYYVKNSAQILPQYLVQYEFDPAKEMKARERAKCENCEQAEATVHCAADAAHLCNKCDTQLHSSKLASRHVRTPIGKGTDVFGFCRHHTDKLVEFFCSQCHIPVCVYCKMVGNHANGDSAKHQLVSVTEAYQAVLQEALTHDPVFQSRRSEINNQIAAIHSRAKAVEKMAASVETHIEEIYKRALAELKHITNTKLDILLGDELELKRQIGEVDRVENFIRYIQTGDATHFLFTWARNQQYRSELHDFRFFRDGIDVQLDVKVTGGITVVQDPGPAYVTTTPARSNGSGPVGSIMSSTVTSPISPGGGGLAGLSNMGAPMAGYAKSITGMPGSPRQSGPGRVPTRGATYTTQPYAPDPQPNFPATIVAKKFPPEKRNQRRASDFFSEALGALDTLSIHQGIDDDGDMSEFGGR